MRIHTDYQYHSIACKGSDHLQLIKFWQTRATGKGVCGGAKFFSSALLQPARSVCVSLSFFHYTNRNRNTTRELRQKK